MRRSRQDGFTLFELLIALGVFGIVLVGTVTLFIYNQNAYRRGRDLAEAQQNARVALQSASREIRIAGYDPSGVLATLPSPTPIQAADADSLTFAADVTRDGVLDQVTYRVAGGQLVRDFSSWDGTAFPAPASGVVAEGVEVWTFEYFDDATPTNTTIAAPVATADLGNIRRIRLQLATGRSSIGLTRTFPLQIDVRLRN